MKMNHTLINRIKERVPITELVSVNTVLKRVGLNKFAGLCPFHNEKTPSFNVFTTVNGRYSNCFHCFGCNAHGDVINYVMLTNGCDFKEAVTTLATQYNIESSGEDDTTDNFKKTYAPTVDHSITDTLTVRSTLRLYELNQFALFLNTYFKDYQLVEALMNQYFIGTAKGGKTIFWQVDKKGFARTGQIIKYNELTGKRDRSIPIYWTHTTHSNYVLNQCFFGLHLLADSTNAQKTIAIVESPKTAVIMSVLMPHFVWLASCGKNNLNHKFEALRGRTILMFPDLGRVERTTKDGIKETVTVYQVWREYVERLNHTEYSIVVSECLETLVKELPESIANDCISKGYDLADFAIENDWYQDLKQQKYTAADVEWFTELYGSIDNYESIVKPMF